VGPDGHIDPGTIATDAAGMATSQPWTLGRVGPQQVVARSASAEVTFTAEGCVSLAWGCGTDAVRSTLAFIRYGDVHRAVSDSAGAVRLTADGNTDYPRWSPDGTRIAFERYGREGGKLFVLHPESGALVDYGRYARPAWSPDGRQLAAVADHLSKSTIFFLSVDDRAEQAVVLTPGTEPSWSPDGTRILFADDGGIHVINADGTGRSTLLAAGPDRWFENPTWSPDGRSIALTVRSNCSWDDACDSAIGVMDAGSSEIRLVAHDMRDNSHVSAAAWSPDGRTIAFSDYSCFPDSCGVTVSTVAVDGRAKRVILAHASSPSWRP
jgi:Tol biopolymer transport system component